MAKALVVVESPAKAKTINKYLGSDYKVVASMGHIRDLPKSKLGVDVEKDSSPTRSSRAQEGPQGAEGRREGRDRHLRRDRPRSRRRGDRLASGRGARRREKKKIRRLMFNEITKKGVHEALKHPTTIDKKMVDAQQARRVLDRLVGYKISPLLWDKVRRGLSAGRVQSVALKLVVRSRTRDRARSSPKSTGTSWRGSPVRSRRSSKRRLLKKGGENIKVGNEAEVERGARRPRSGGAGSSRRSRRRSARRAPLRRSSRASCSRPRASRSRRR